MSFQDLLNEARKQKSEQVDQENRQKDAREKALQSFINGTPESISKAARDYYGQWCQELAESIANGNKKTIRVYFPEMVEYLPTVYSKEVTFHLPTGYKSYNRYTDDEYRIGIILINKESDKGPFSLTRYGQQFFEEVQALAKNDKIKISDVICVRRTEYYSGRRRKVEKDMSLSNARPHFAFLEDHSLDYFSFHLDISYPQ